MEYREDQKQEGSAVYQEADVSSKRIFGNHTLCAQFLRDYSGLPMLTNVQPEDIEDVSERYHLFREVELESDTQELSRFSSERLNDILQRAPVDVVKIIAATIKA